MKFERFKWLVALCATYTLVISAACSPQGDASTETPRLIDGITEIAVADPVVIGGGAGPDDDFVLPLVSGRDASGAIYVLDLRESELRRFGRDGSFEGIIARRGRGPGELLAPSSMSIDSSYIHIWDGRLSRYSRLSQDGHLEFDVTFDAPYRFQRGQSTSAVSFVSDSSAILAVRSEVLPSTRHGRPVVRVAYVRAKAGVASRDTLYAFEALTSTIVIDFARTRISDPGPRPGPFVYFDELEESVVRIDSPPPTKPDSAAFTIMRIDSAGRTARVVEYATRPRPLLGAERDSLRESFTKSLASATGGTLSRNELNEIAANMQWPDYRPAVADAALSRSGDGRIWVKLAGQRFDAGSTWVVFDRDLDPVGKVRLPLDLQYVAPFDGEVWGTAEVGGILVVAGFGVSYE